MNNRLACKEEGIILVLTHILQIFGIFWLSISFLSFRSIVDFDYTRKEAVFYPLAINWVTPAIFYGFQFCALFLMPFYLRLGVIGKLGVLCMYIILILLVKELRKKHADGIRCCSRSRWMYLLFIGAVLFLYAFHFTLASLFQVAPYPWWLGTEFQVNPS